MPRRVMPCLAARGRSTEYVIMLWHIVMESHRSPLVKYGFQSSAINMLRLPIEKIRMLQNAVECNYLTRCHSDWQLHFNTNQTFIFLLQYNFLSYFTFLTMKNKCRYSELTLGEPQVQRRQGWIVQTSRNTSSLGSKQIVIQQKIIQHMEIGLENPQETQVKTSRNKQVS